MIAAELHPAAIDGRSNTTSHIAVGINGSSSVSLVLQHTNQEFPARCQVCRHTPLKKNMYQWHPNHPCIVYGLCFAALAPADAAAGSSSVYLDIPGYRASSPGAWGGHLWSSQSLISRASRPGPCCSCLCILARLLQSRVGGYDMGSFSSN